MKIKQIVPIISLLFFFHQNGFSQSYYDSQRQNREYQSLQDATKRAYSVPSSTYTAPKYQSSSSYGSSNSSSSSNSSRVNSIYNSNSSNNSYIDDAADQEEAAKIKRDNDAYRLQKQKDDEARWALRAIEDEKNRVFEASLRDKLTKDGFYPIEINGICTDYRNKKTGGIDENTYFMKNIFQANAIIENLRLNYEIAPFESIAIQIKNLLELRAPFTAIDYITVIEDRFPDKKSELQQIKLETAYCFSKYYTSFFGSDENEELLQKFIYFYTLAEDNDAKLNTKLQAMFPKDKWQYYSPYNLMFKVCYWHLECKTCSSSETYRKYKNKLTYYQDREKKQN